MYTGMDTVNNLYERLEVEDKWSVRYENGFKWWPCGMAQTVEVAGESNKLAFITGYYISVRTEICKVSKMGPNICSLLNGTIMPCASMAGLVYNPDKGVIELCSWILAFEHYREWMERALWAAAALQVHEGETMVNFIGSAGGMGPAVSGHPKKGSARKRAEAYYRAWTGLHLQEAGHRPGSPGICRRPRIGQNPYSALIQLQSAKTACLPISRLLTCPRLSE